VDMGRLWELVEGLDTKLAGPPTPAPVASVQKSEGGTHQTPRARLVSLLTAWANMDESEWTEEAVDRLKNDILDVFAAHPGEADGWYQAWRGGAPECTVDVRE
jgi:hypothetical protein